ncbi:MAG: class I SAM-dependent methyltransferase [Spirochaetales bacterium]|nr:class I SAM-dependent methyltransferase [Spirochaetales bacterium]
MRPWTAESIRYRIAAAETGSMEETIARHIAAHLSRDSHVCDAGCGLGHLSLELASYFRQVTAVDTCQPALDVLIAAKTKRGVGNIRVLREDFFSMRPHEPYDAIVFCNFGSLGEILASSKKQCQGKAIIIKKNWDYHRFSLARTPRRGNSFKLTASKLKALEIPCEEEVFTVETGQPFSELQDAVGYFKLNRPDGCGEEITAEKVGRMLVPGPSERYPLQCSVRESFGLLVVRTEDIP